MVPDERTGPLAVHCGGEIRYVNESFLVLVGADSREELLETSISRFFSPEDSDALSGQFERIGAGSDPALGLAVELQPLAGRPHETVVVSSQVEWEGETCLQSAFLPLASSDEASLVTLRDQAMQEAPIGITIADARQDDLPLIFVNDSFVELTGYDHEEIIGRNCRFLQGEQTRHEPVARMRTAIENEKPVTVTLRNYRKDGSMFWNRVTLSPIENEAGEVTHYLGFQEDVSEEKLYEHEKTLFEKQAEATEQAMLITDREGRIEYVNPAFEQLTGYDSEEVRGETPSVFRSGEQSAAFYRELRETLESGETWETTLWNRTKSGELFQVEQTIVPIIDDHGEITHFATIERDITEELLTEQILDVLNRVLRHNVRTSINVIEGYTDLLEEQLDDPEKKAMLETISDRAAALEKISDQTTAIRELFEVESQDWDLASLAEVVETYRSRYPDASIEFDRSLGGERAIKDGGIFQLAFEEALENAIEHSDREAPEVAVTAAEASRDDHVRVVIADDGPGIPESEWAVIRSGEETPLAHGSGLGLWVMYWSVTALGGTIEIRENEPRGSLVVFELPLAGTQ